MEERWRSTRLGDRPLTNRTRSEEEGTVTGFVKRNKWVILGTGLLLLAAVLYWLWRRSRDKEEEEKEEKERHIGFDVNKVIGKRGLLHVESKGYLRVKPGTPAEATEKPLEFSPDKNTATQWIWEVAVVNEKEEPGHYRFEQVGSRSSSVTPETASFLSVNDFGVASSRMKPTRSTVAWEKFQAEPESPGSPRFQLIGVNIKSNLNVKPDISISPDDFFTFETL